MQEKERPLVLDGKPMTREELIEFYKNLKEK